MRAERDGAARQKGINIQTYRDMEKSRDKDRDVQTDK